MTWVSDRVWRRAAVLALCTSAFAGRADAEGQAEAPAPAVGARGEVGCGPNPRRVRRLEISEPGVYEDLLVDGEWSDSTLVKITADGVTLRRWEIRRGRHNAVAVYAKDVVIERCRIHHVLAGTFDAPRDAHGITGRPTNLTVRDCDVGLVSGDALQFDPGRGAWDDVHVEHCTLWAGPLAEDAAGFRKGERPGENAVDTKQRASNPRSRLTVRNCLLTGWNQPGQMGNMAALNLKNHVAVRVEGCLFWDNEVGLRVRGGAGEYGGALVSVDGCAVYDTAVAVRAEDGVRDLKIGWLGVGAGVGRTLVSAGGGAGEGFEYAGEFEPPPFEWAVREGLPPPSGP